ncbi:MAG: hypothetical protein J0L97_05755, partial [Alphaproteobacteria bacterium]|nr:hypothetical protein [Alphaproteobacteria bacterium]
SVFGQVNRNHTQEGTGLGLPLCRMFAELHGGKLTLHSEVNRGTRVMILIPASRVRAGGEKEVLPEASGHIPESSAAVPAQSVNDQKSTASGR